MTVKEVCEFFWKLEEKHGLVSDKNKRHHWLPVRFRMYYYVTTKIGLFEDPHPTKAAPSVHKGSRKAIYLPFGQKKYALFPLPRKIGGEDIYSTEMLKTLGPEVDIIDQGENVLEGALLIDSLHRLSDKIFPFFHRYFKKRYSSKEKDLWLKEISEKFNIPFKKLKSFYIKRFMEFLILEKLYLILFTLRKYRKIYLVGSYFRMYIISAAKKKGIPIAELQHGIITPYHLGYSYPNREENPYFPNELICTGKFWAESTPFPSGVKFHLIKPVFIERLSLHRSQNANMPGKVVFNSQGVIGTDIFKFAHSVAKLCPELEIIFRLHPSEQLSKYEELLTSLGTLSNFSLSHKNPNIFSLMSEAEYVVGVFSTTLFEAMLLGAKVILINMTGIEYMAPVIQKNDAILVSTPEEFKLKYTSAKPVADVSNYYARESSKDLIST